MIKRREWCARAGDEYSMGLPGLKLVTGQRGGPCRELFPAESCFLSLWKWRFPDVLSGALVGLLWPIDHP